VRQRLWTLCCCLVALLPSSGCRTVYPKNEVIRGDEPQIPVQFESAKGAELFTEHVRRQERGLDETAFCVPFVTLYACKTELSKNARFNDAVLTCDRDRNGWLTDHEVFHYCGKCPLRGEPSPPPSPTTPVEVVAEPPVPGHP
jgi:hypothetical protein